MSDFDGEKWKTFMEGGEGSAILGKLLDLIHDSPLAQNKTVSSLLKMAPLIIKLVPLVGTAIAVIAAEFPGDSRQEIVKWFETLRNKVDSVKDELERTIKWESVKLQYGTPVATIQLGMEFSQMMNTAAEDGERNRKWYASRLEELGSNQNFSLAVNALIDGLTGKGLFKTAIMDEYYLNTGGYLAKVTNFADQLLNLLYGGLIVIFTYETCRRGVEAAQEILKRYNEQIPSIQEKVQDVIDRCLKKFKINMEKDLNEILDSNRSNENAVSDLSALVSEKYDWLETYCIICAESVHVEYFFTGNHVKSSERNGKFGVICYRKISGSKINQETRNAVAQILEQIRNNCDPFSYSAANLCSTITDRIQKECEVEVCACVVIRPKSSLGIIPGYGLILYPNCSATYATLKEKDSCSTACRDFLGDHGRFGFSRSMRYFLVLLK